MTTLTASTALPLTWFEIPVRDLPRAEAFYATLCGAPGAPAP